MQMATPEWVATTYIRTILITWRKVKTSLDLHHYGSGRISAVVPLQRMKIHQFSRAMFNNSCLEIVELQHLLDQDSQVRLKQRRLVLVQN